MTKPIERGKSGSYDDYIIHEDRQDGRVEFSRVTEEAPQHIAVTLELIQKAAPGLLDVHRNSLTILGDRYRITGWDSFVGALVCDLETP